MAAAARVGPLGALAAWRSLPVPAQPHHCRLRWRRALWSASYEAGADAGQARAATPGRPQAPAPGYGHGGATATTRAGYRLSDEVAAALAAGAPVVALESTIISHGLPYPNNLHMARDVEAILRGHGVVPATVAILESEVCVGLSAAQLSQLAEAGKEARKVSRRDFAVALAEGAVGATTVSGTMIAAHAAGIPVFVTGGLGGVHRGGELSMDISADLTELGRTPVAVVCAGVKSILDIGRTLEYLETQGVFVAAVGDSDEFPAFFTPRSGFKAAHRLPSPQACAEAVRANAQLGLQSGMVLAVPIPEEHAANPADLETHIQTALAEAEAGGVAGKDVTPFVLKRLVELSDGASLQANLDLVKHNAHVGAQIAVELARLGGYQTDQPARLPTGTPAVGAGEGALSGAAQGPVVIGGVTLDCISRLSSDSLQDSTNPGTVTLTVGGVARNVAEALHRLECAPTFFSAVGQDAAGGVVQGALHDLGMDARLSTSDGYATAVYTAVLSSAGEVATAVGQMDILDSLSPSAMAGCLEALREAPLVILDGNMPEASLALVVNACHRGGVPVFFEPTSLDKAVRPSRAGILDKMDFVSPNFVEFCGICEAEGILPSPAATADLVAARRAGDLDPVLNCAQQLGSRVPNVLLSLGAQGIIAPPPDHDPWGSSGPALFHHYPVDTVDPVVSASGAGDSFVAGFCWALLQHRPYGEAVRLGMRAARLALAAPSSISPQLRPAALRT